MYSVCYVSSISLKEQNLVYCMNLIEDTDVLSVGSCLPTGVCIWTEELHVGLVTHGCPLAVFRRK